MIIWLAFILEQPLISMIDRDTQKTSNPFTMCCFNVGFSFLKKVYIESEMPVLENSPHPFRYDSLIKKKTELHSDVAASKSRFCFPFWHWSIMKRNQGVFFSGSAVGDSAFLTFRILRVRAIFRRIRMQRAIAAAQMSK